MPSPSEDRLVDSIRRGDRDAAATMVEQTYELVFASVFRLCGDRDLAADLTQETYRKAWESFAGFNGSSRISTWLYRIAYTTFLNHVRGPRRMVSFDESSSERVLDGSPAADDRLAKDEESERLRHAVLALPDDLRFTVTAHFWGELPVKEVARLERITSVAVRKRLRKAFALLQEALTGPADSNMPRAENRR